MGKDIYRIIGLILVAIVGALGAAAATHVLVTLPYPNNKGAEWVSAIGTVGTLIGTIWLATSESRRRRDAEFLAATLHAHAFMPRIAMVRTTCTAVARLLGRVATGELPPQSVNDGAKHLLALNSWSIDELAPLAPLSSAAVKKLAQGSELFAILQKLLSPELNTIYLENPVEAPAVLKLFSDVERLLKSGEAQLLECAGKHDLR